MEPLRHRVDVFLAPGELAVHVGSVNIKTIVGSCVAVCLWDRGRQIGGVNHFLLAVPGPRDEGDARFGSCATPLLVDAVCRAGAVRGDLRGAIVGGGRPVQPLRSSRIGDDNIAVALAVLASYGIPVSRQETGGAHGRKLLFNPHTGELLVRALGRTVAGRATEVRG